MPLRSNWKATDPCAPIAPPALAKMARTSPAVRFLLSVSTSTTSATPAGPYPSYVLSSYATPSNSPVPFLTARVMVSFGMFASRAARTAERRRALWSGSPPPVRAATVTSRISLVKSAPLLAPIASFLRLILVHRLWPDMAAPRLPFRAHLARAARMRQRSGWPARRAPVGSTHPGARAPRLDALSGGTPRLGARIAVDLGHAAVGVGGEQRDERRRVVRQPTPEEPLRGRAQHRYPGRERIAARVEGR